MHDVDETLAWCANEEANGGPDWKFHCLAMCRVAWGIPAPVFPDAMTAWRNSTQHTDQAPQGAPIYFTLPNLAEGHVAIQGADRQWCWSIDILRPDGHIDYVPIQLLREKWGARDLGWTSDLEHVALPLGPLPGAGVEWLQPGMRIVADAAFPPSPQSLLDAGYQALASYLSTPVTQGKNWSPLELVGCRQAGLSMIMFAEQSEQTVLTGYSDANLLLGRTAQGMADSFGYPDECPIWFAVDLNAGGQFDKVFGAFRAYRETNHRPLGCYGGSQIIEALMDEGLCDYGHIAAAVSWSVTGAPVDNETVFFFRTGTNPNGTPKGFNYYLTPRAHMRQYPSEAFAGTRIDPNDVDQSIPVWKVGATSSPQPPSGNTSEAAMAAPLLTVNRDPYPEFEPAKSLGYVPPDGPGGLWPIGWIWYERMPTEVGGGKRWFPGGPEFNAVWGFYTANSLQPAQMTTGELQSMPDYKPPSSGAAHGTVDIPGQTVEVSIPGQTVGF